MRLFNRPTQVTQDNSHVEEHRKRITDLESELRRLKETIERMQAQANLGRWFKEKDLPHDTELVGRYYRDVNGHVDKWIGYQVIWVGHGPRPDFPHNAEWFWPDV